MTPENDSTQNMITEPNYTQIPNVIFDYWMSQLSPAEFKVLLCICRKTFGWQKRRDRISLRQIEKMTGLGKSSIIKNVEKLIELNLVIKIKSKDEFDGSDAPNQYEINVISTEEVQKNRGGSILSIHPPVHSEYTPPVHSVDTQKKDITKETIQKKISPEPKSAPSDHSIGLSSLLFEKRKEINPLTKKPNLEKWAKHIDLLINVDKRDPEMIRQVIEYLPISFANPSKNGFSWGEVTRSAEKLRENFAELWQEMRKAKLAKSDPKKLSPEEEYRRKEEQKMALEKEHMSISKKIYQALPQEHRRALELADNYIRFYSVVINYSDADFRKQFSKQLKSRGIDPNSLSDVTRKS